MNREPAPKPGCPCVVCAWTRHNADLADNYAWTRHNADLADNYAVFRSGELTDRIDAELAED